MLSSPDRRLSSKEELQLPGADASILRDPEFLVEKWHNGHKAA